MSPRTRLVLVVLLVVAGVVCIRLALWQLTRLRERRAANATISSALARPEVHLDSVPPESLAFRRVRASGEYDHAHEFVIRGQAHRERPGVTVVTPLRLRGRNDAVLVLRGFVAAADATTADLDSLAEPGEHTVRGSARPLGHREDGGARIVRAGRTTWRGLDSAAVAAALPYPVLPIVIQQTPDSTLPRFPRRLPPPALDDGPHLSYTIQWFAFATIAIVGGVGLIAQPRRSTARAPSASAPPPTPPAA